MKKTIKVIGISFLILILFRGFIYRLAVNYDEIGTRKEIEITSKDLIYRIEAKSANREIGIEEVIEISMTIASEELKFTTKQVSNNPNELINSHQANCIGYAGMFNSIANYMIQARKLNAEIDVKHRIGQLYLFGINLHQFFSNAFFKDHDFNEIKNRITGELILVDPSVYDNLGIKRVSKRE